MSIDVKNLRPGQAEILEFSYSALAKNRDDLAEIRKNNGAMSTPLLQPSLAFGVLIERLRLRGFAVGTADFLRMQTLLERVAGYCTPGEVKTLLCPIFARSREQQQIFCELFDEFWREAELGASAQLGVLYLLEDPPQRAQRLPPPPPDSPTVGKYAGSRNCPDTLAGRIRSVPAAETATQRHSKTSYQVYKCPDAFYPLGHYSVDTRRDSGTAFDSRWAAAYPGRFRRYRPGCMAGVLFMDQALAHERSGSCLAALQAALLVGRAAEANDGRFLPLGKFYTAARKLRLRLASGRQVLDLPSTIGATLKLRGYPRLRYRTVTRPGITCA